MVGSLLKVNCARVSLLFTMVGLSLCCLCLNLLLYTFLTSGEQKRGKPGSLTIRTAGGNRVVSVSDLGRRCSSEEIEFNAKGQPQYNSQCPRNPMYMASLVAHNELAETDVAERDRTPVIVRIGCNKGDDFILSMRQWSKNGTYSSRNLYNYQSQFNFTGPSGYVCDKLDENLSDSLQEDASFTSALQSMRFVRGFCIEPMSTTMGMLISTFKTLGYQPPDVTLIQAAVSNYPGTAYFPISDVGREDLGLQHADTSTEKVQVQVITLDSLVRESNIEKIDYLSIDTEGNDMQVILGGIHIFAAHLIRYFEFEYHFTGRWQTSNLRDLIELLDLFGYDCYWALNSGNLTRITGCWHEDYNEKWWSNVACISRKEIYTNKLMESLTNFEPSNRY